MQIDIALKPEDFSLPSPAFIGTLEQIKACPTAPGCYLIWLCLERSTKLQKPEPHILPPGWYIYAGSAKGPGGLQARLRRHLQSEKKIRWHIDQISTQAIIHFAWGWQETDWPGGSECTLVTELLDHQCMTQPIRTFGSSDCRVCKSHLMAYL